MKKIKMYTQQLISYLKQETILFLLATFWKCVHIYYRRAILMPDIF